MAIVEGKIEPLKKIKEILNQNGITRFGSIGEINEFVKNYQTEKNQIPEKIKNELDGEINQLQLELVNHQNNYDVLKANATDEINSEIKRVEEELKLIAEGSNKNIIGKIFQYLRTRNLIKQGIKLKSDFDLTVQKKTHFSEQEVHKRKNKIEYYISNKERVISERCLKMSRELDRTKEIVDNLYPLIAGAIGENSVIKEIQKLSDDFHLFNDFAIEFYPPIYNKKEDDRIFSIQIDHLLVCESGIFILETKNWSNKSLENIDLRSPVKQILRSSYALFVLLNSHSEHDSIGLDGHHWGSKQIPVRNIIVMTNKKPKEEFKHVKVLALQELNGYITYFDPIFSKAEVKSVCNYLKTKMV